MTEPAPVRERASGERAGIVAGAAAYSLWGLFPLVFHELEEVGAGEILLHRILWSFLVVLILLAVGRRGRPWFADVRDKPGARTRLAAAAVCIAVNWLVYIWAVNHGHVVEAALGYYICPLITVALGIVVLGERLRRVQYVALGLGGVALVVLTVAYGRIPWIAVVLACSFAAYGFLKKAVSVGAVTSLAIETAVLVPFAVLAMTALQVQGEAAFGHGRLSQDLLLASLGLVTAVPLLLFGAAASRIPLSMLGLLQYLTPTIQLLCGVLVLGEPLPPERLAGFMLVWVALALLGVDAVRSGRSRDAEPLPVVEPA